MSNDLMQQTLALMNAQFKSQYHPNPTFPGRGNIINGRPVGADTTPPPVAPVSAKRVLPEPPMSLKVVLNHGRP